jgi:hypothetical protein
MSAEALFSLCNGFTLAGWVLLAAVPGWRWVPGLITAVLLPCLLALVYGFLLISHLPGAEGGFGSLKEILMLFQNPSLLLAAWIHYLAFDLFIGSWEVRDSRQHGIPHWLVLPCLILTFLLGPLGLLCYLSLRAALRRRCVLDRDNA